MRLPKLLVTTVLPAALVAGIGVASPAVASDHRQTTSSSTTSSTTASVADFVESLQAAKDPKDARIVMLSGINDTGSTVHLRVSGNTSSNVPVTPIIDVTVKPGESGKFQSLRSIIKSLPHIASLTVTIDGSDKVLKLPVTGTEFTTIDGGGELRLGDSTRSTDGRSLAKLTYRDSHAMLTVTKNGSPVSTVVRVPSADGSKLRLTLDTDGMLTLLGATKPWNSGAAGRADSKSGPLVAEVSNDGGFVLVGSKDHQIYWRDGLNVDMRNGERLHPDKVICSPDGSTKFVAEPFHGFSLHKNGTCVWRVFGWFAYGNLDGNELRGVDRENNFWWKSNTARLVTEQTGDLILRVTNDARLEFVGSKNGQVVWANGSPTTPQQVTKINPGETIVDHTALVSPDGKSELRVENGNIAVFHDGAKVWKLIEDYRYKHLRMTGNNLVAVSSNGTPITPGYSSDTAKFVTPETGDLCVRINNAGKLEFVGMLNVAVVHTI